MRTRALLHIVKLLRCGKLGPEYLARTDGGPFPPTPVVRCFLFGPASHSGHTGLKTRTAEYQQRKSQGTGSRESAAGPSVHPDQLAAARPQGCYGESLL